MTPTGKPPERHKFILNPYQDVRFSRCPICDGPTRQRKFPLLIHVQPMMPVALNKTCRYCTRCDLIIAHQDEIEAQLVYVFKKRYPKGIGNDYFVLGTMDRADWRQGCKTPLPVGQLLNHVHLFQQVLSLKPSGG